MGKVQHSKQNTRPAAQSHTAHKFNSPRHGKTPTGFTVKPAKPELVPIYNVNQRVSFDTPAKQALGAILLLGTLGSVIKVAQATECANTRPPNPTVTGVTANVTVNCYDDDLFYGQNIPLIETISMDGHCSVYYYLYERRCTGWWWSEDCKTYAWHITKAVPCVIYESRQGQPHTKVCHDRSWGVEIRDVWGTTDPRRTLGTDDNFDPTCRRVVAECAAVKSFVCESPTPTPTPSSSEVSVPATSTEVLTSSETSTPILAPSSIDSADTPYTSSIDDQMMPTPSPELIADEVASAGSKVTGALIGIAAVGGLIGAGMVAAKAVITKKTENKIAPEGGDLVIENTAAPTDGLY